MHCDAHVVKMILETAQMLVRVPLNSIGYVLPETDKHGNTLVPYKPW